VRFEVLITSTKPALSQYMTSHSWTHRNMPSPPSTWRWRQHIFQHNGTYLTQHGVTCHKKATFIK